MRRIPSFDGRKAADHLVPTTRVGFTQYGKPTFRRYRRAFRAPPAMPARLLRDVLLAFGPVTGSRPTNWRFSARASGRSSPRARSAGSAEYERTSWWEFVGAEQRSASYQKFLAAGFTRSLVAAKARKASARTVGDMFVQMMLTILDPTGGSTDRVLDGPTNLVWIDPWRSYLEIAGRAVRHASAEVEEILCDEPADHRRRRAAGKGKRTLVERRLLRRGAPARAHCAALINERLLAVDPALANLRALAPNVEWMNGVQFYLRRDVPTAHGHVIHIDTRMGADQHLAAPVLAQHVPPDQFGDSDVRGVLSVDVSDWTAPGSNGRPAMQCSREEVVRETWAQLKRSINVERELLRDEDLHSWFLDPDIEKDAARPGFLHNLEPLLVNLVNTWALRPEATTAIPNLFLASDYVRTYTDLATMEGANEAARRAVNGLLDAVEFDGPRCEIWPLHEPEILAPWRLHDAARYEAGLPWDNSLDAGGGPRDPRRVARSRTRPPRSRPPRPMSDRSPRYWTPATNLPEQYDESST